MTTRRTATREAPSTEWTRVPLRAVADAVSGGTPSSRIAAYWNGTVPWCTPTDITRTRGKYLLATERRITEQGLANCSASLLPAGALLLCTRATIGEVKIATFPVCSNQGFKSLVCKAGMYNEFLYYLVLMLKPQLIERATGSTFLEISKHDLLSIELGIPPYLEQQAIATTLSDVDRMIDTLDALIVKKRNIHSAVMQQLIRGVTRLDGCRHEWAWSKLGDAITVRYGRSQRGLVMAGEFPVFGSGGRIGSTNQILYDKPSVLIGRKGTIDDPLYASCPFWAIDTMFYTEIADGMCPRFLYYLFRMIPWQRYNEASGLPSLNARTIESIGVRLPGLGEQEAIADVLSDMDAEIRTLELRRNKVLSIKQAMMQQLLTGRVRLAKPVTMAGSEGAS